MTDEIIKALECCINKKCFECSFRVAMNCSAKVPMAFALNLIKRQQARIEQEVDLNREMFEKMARDEAEIERKGKILNSYALQYGTVTDQSKKIKEIKDEAYKEFAERLKEHMCSYDFSNYHYFKAIDEDTLDEVLKEMTEVSNGK